MKFRVTLRLESDSQATAEQLTAVARHAILMGFIVHGKGMEVKDIDISLTTRKKKPRDYVAAKQTDLPL
jgi:hypothetical protein